jgi:hypothetical protein
LLPCAAVRARGHRCGPLPALLLVLPCAPPPLALLLLLLSPLTFRWVGRSLMIC